MSVTYGFYNSLDGDRKYNATHLNQLFDGIITDGIFSTWGDQFQVTPTESIGKSCIVHTGKAWLDNTWTINDSLLTFSTEIPEISMNTRKRIDMVCIEVDKENRVNTIKYVVGEEVANTGTAVRPTPTDIQYPIAYIAMFGADFSNIHSENITMVVGQSRTNGGTPLVTGMLQQMSISQLTKKWEAAFEIWFDDMKGQITEDAAINLQNQINTLIQYGSEPCPSSLGSGKVYFQYEEEAQ